MKELHAMSLRWQLAAAACVGLVAAFAVFFVVLEGVLSASYEQHIREGDAETAAALAKSIHQYINGAERLARLAAAEPGLMDKSPREQHLYLRRMAGDKSSFELLALLDTHGMQTARSEGDIGNRSDREWFKKFIAGQKYVVSSVYYSASTLNLIVTLVQGVYRSGDLKGIFMADMKVESIENMIRSLHDNQGTNAYLIDQSGNIIVHPGASSSDGLPNVSNGSLAKARKESGIMFLSMEPLPMDSGLRRELASAMWKEPGSSEFTDAGGTQWICTYQPVELPDPAEHWTLVLVRDYSVTRASINKAIASLLAAGIAVTILGCLAVMFLAGRATRPLAELVKGTEAVRDGDYSGHIPASGSSEMQALAGAFNEMLRSLREAREQQLEAEAQIRDMAFTDTLTGLPNRTSFNTYAPGRLGVSMGLGESGAFFIIDADKFKFVNDTYGHATGDLLLIEFGKRLEAAAGEKGRAFRYGGDEFFMLMTGADESEAAAAAEAIVTAMREPFLLDGNEISISASVGIVCYKGTGGTLADLMRQSDTALYIAKKNGRDRAVFYRPEMESVEKN